MKQDVLRQKSFSSETKRQGDNDFIPTKLDFFVILSNVTIGLPVSSFFHLRRWHTHEFVWRDRAQA